MTPVIARPTSTVTGLRLLAASLAALVAATAAGCDGGTRASVTGAPISVEQLAQSASTSAHATSGRFAFEISATVPGAEEPFSSTGGGAFDAASKRASFSVDLSSLAKLLGGFFTAVTGASAKDAPNLGDPAGWKIEVVQDGTVGYVRFPAVSRRLPAGTSWIRADEKGVEVDGLELTQLEQSARTDPRELLDVLRAAAGEVETVGTEELRGTETAHYRATVDPAEYEKLVSAASLGESPALARQFVSQAGAGPIPVDVWLDGDGLVRRLSLSSSATKPGIADAGSASLSFELWDYDEVVDASALRR